MSPEEGCLATFWRQATPGSAYVRLELPARYLPGQVLDLEDDDVSMNDLDELVMPRQAGAAIWQFVGSQDRAIIAAAQQTDLDIPVLMEVDDNYTVPSPWRGSEWARTISEGNRLLNVSHEGHRRILRGAFTGVIASTPYLADLYSQYNDNVFLCPNCVDPQDWQFDRPEPDGILRIVYAGSPSHERDAPLVKKALKWAARQPDVEVYVMGFDPYWSFATVLPWEETLEAYRLGLFQFDIGVAPLKDDKWSRAKSDLKALEYAMAGVMPLVQDVESFREWGDLAVTDWEEALRYWVRNRDEVALTAEAAKQYVLAERTIETNIDAWKEAVSGK